LDLVIVAGNTEVCVDKQVRAVLVYLDLDFCKNLLVDKDIIPASAWGVVKWVVPEDRLERLHRSARVTNTTALSRL